MTPNADAPAAPVLAPSPSVGPVRRLVTPAMHEANRANSAGSTGPQTISGKKASSLNSTKHSLTASPETLRRAHPELFHGIAAEFAREFAPVTLEQETHFELLVSSCVKMRLHQHTEAAAVQDARAQTRKSWDFQRAQEAQERLLELDEQPLLSGRMLRALLGCYHTRAALAARFLKHAQQLAETRVLHRSTIHDLRKYSGYSLLSAREDELPETLRDSFLDLVDPKEGASLDDSWLEELLGWITAQRAHLESELPELELEEEDHLRDVLVTLEIPHDSRVSRLRYRYAREAERAFFKALAALESCRVHHAVAQRPRNLDRLVTPPPAPPPSESAAEPPPALEPTAPVEPPPNPVTIPGPTGGTLRRDPANGFVSSSDSGGATSPVHSYPHVDSAADPAAVVVRRGDLSSLSSEAGTRAVRRTTTRS